MKFGVTLIEVIVVVIIIGILATLGLTQYGGFREQTLDREAQTNLKLIIAAARIYRMEVGVYWAAANTALINANYKLRLPDPPTNATWTYRTTANNTATPPTCCAQATRTIYGRTWKMNTTTPEPVSGLACP